MLLCSLLHVVFNEQLYAFYIFSVFHPLTQRPQHIKVINFMGNPTAILELKNLMGLSTLGLESGSNTLQTLPILDK